MIHAPNWQDWHHETRIQPQHHDPQPSRPRPPAPTMPSPQRPHPPVHGVTPEMPVLPNAPRPPRAHRPSSLPMGFPMMAHAQPGIVIGGRGSMPMHRWPVFFSPVIDRIPRNTFVWVFGERNGWSAVHYNGHVGFVDSRFVILF